MHNTELRRLGLIKPQHQSFTMLHQGALLANVY